MKKSFDYRAYAACNTASAQEPAVTNAILYQRQALGQGQSRIDKAIPSEKRRIRPKPGFTWAKSNMGNERSIYKKKSPAPRIDENCLRVTEFHKP
jgi:hypothetical protein